MIQKKRRNIFAVCDLEVSYACNFMEYMNRKRNIPFEIQAFTNVTALQEFCREQEIELLLISDKAMCDAVKELPVGKLVILSEGVHYPGLDQYPSVYKYQASDNVIREVMEVYGAEKEQHPQDCILKKKTEIIAIYSPVGRVQKTSFALALGQILAKERAVLYINMENYSGFEQIFAEGCERNLSDLLYYLRQENTNLVHKINGMVQSLQNLDYIPPVFVPSDIQSTTGEEWLRLLEELCRYSSYEAVILDLGDGVQDLLRILDACDRIYMPVRKDALSEAKIRQFENHLRTWEYTSLQENIIKLHLPYHNTGGTGKNCFQGLVWSELGDYVRQLLRKERTDHE